MRAIKFYSVLTCFLGAVVVGNLRAQDATTSCDTTNGTQFNLEPRLNAVPQNTESVAFLLNRVGAEADLVVAAANDSGGGNTASPRLGGFDAYYVHRTGIGCGVDFEGTISTHAINPTVVADSARDAFFLADNILSISPAVELARTTSTDLLSPRACPSGTQLNGNNPNCWPVLGEAIFTNSNPNAQLTLRASYLAVDPRASGTGAGDVYVAAQIEDSTNFPAVSSIQIAACPNATVACGTPAVVSGTDTFASAPYIQVRHDGVITVSYRTFTKPFGTLPNPVDVKFTTCQPQGAPMAPMCSKPNLVATSEVVPGFVPGDSGFRDSLFPKHVNRLEADGTSYTTFLIYDKCQSTVGSSSNLLAPACSKINLVLTTSTNGGATWSMAQPVETAVGHQFFGAIHNDVATRITNIAYYSTQKDPFLQRARIYLSQIAAGSTTPGPARALLSGETDPDAGIQDFVEPNAEDVIDFGDRIGLASAGTGTAGQSRLYVHYTWNNVFGISNGTKQPDPNNTLVPLTY